MQAVGAETLADDGLDARELRRFRLGLRSQMPSRVVHDDVSDKSTSAEHAREDAIYSFTAPVIPDT
ncbi:hypothetical protein SAMN05216345_11495 [Cupriavidus sp. YR651]|nr:hypothetical protein SAMN05216345_11495 [Cupriavidus sp. YR651]